MSSKRGTTSLLTLCQRPDSDTLEVKPVHGRFSPSIRINHFGAIGNEGSCFRKRCNFNGTTL